MFYRHPRSSRQLLGNPRQGTAAAEVLKSHLGVAFKTLFCENVKMYHLIPFSMQFCKYQGKPHSQTPACFPTSGI